MLGDLGTLQTPSRRSEFIIDSVTLDRFKVAVGDTTLVIPKGTFEAVLDYLHLNHHHAGNPCAIKSDNSLADDVQVRRVLASTKPQPPES